MAKLTVITDEWNSRYDTHSQAEPVEHRHVESVLAVRLEHGHLRGSDFSGIFEVADITEPFDIKDGNLRVHVMTH